MRASGVVIAVDEWEERSIYTLDDGSGATIQCVVNVAPRGLPGATTTTTTSNQYQYTRPLPVIDAPIDVGHVLDIRGSVGTFRDTKNIRAEKIAHLGSTEQEVLFWEKVVLLRRDVLSQPWVLDQRTVRRCKREEEGRVVAAPAGRHRHRAGVTGLEKKGRRERADYGGEGGERSAVERALPKRPRITGLERRSGNTVERRSVAGLEKTRVTGLERGSGLRLARKSETGLENRKETGLEKRVTGLERKRETGLERRGQTGLERGKETGLGQRRVTGLEKRSASGPDRKETCLEKKRVTGLEKRVATKPITRVIPVTGKYDALGL